MPWCPWCETDNGEENRICQACLEKVKTPVSKPQPSPSKHRRTTAILFFLLSLFAADSWSATAHWDAGTDSTIQGYRLYRAEGSCLSPGYFAFVALYSSTAVEGPVPNPSTSGSYCHFLTAFNGAGESPISNYAEFTYSVAEPPQCPEVSYCKTLKGQARKQCLACR